MSTLDIFVEKGKKIGREEGIAEVEKGKAEKSNEAGTEGTTDAERESETQYLKHSLSAGADLLGDLMGNIADDDDGPERKRRKKNEHSRSRGISR